jgi:hypothetical protein
MKFSTVKKFFLSVPGIILVLGIGGVLLIIQAFMSTSKRQAETAPTQTRQQAQEKENPIGATVQEFGTSFLPYSAPPIEEQMKKSNVPVIPPEIKERIIAAPERLTLFSLQQPGPEPQPKPTPSPLYLPGNRLIICRLINAVDTANIETPIIAQVIAPVYNIDENGVSHEVIPAGIEITGWAAASRMRDRIASNGSFKLIWRVPDPVMNGKELAISGIALNREFDASTGIYGIADASAGIKGDIINANSDEELKVFAAAFINGLTPLLADTNDALNPLTNQNVQTPNSNLQNAALGGVQAVMQEYLNRMRLTIAKDGFFVAVKPGTQFYVYTTAPIDISQASRPVAVPANPATPTIQTQAVAGAPVSGNSSIAAMRNQAIRDSMGDSE